MKVLKHGIYPEKNKVICDKCKCEFQYFDSEIKKEYSSYEEYETFEAFTTFVYVICPECKNKIEINRYTVRDYREGFITKVKKYLKSRRTSNDRL